MNNEKIYVYNHNINTAGFLKKTLKVCDFAEWIVLWITGLVGRMFEEYQQPESIATLPPFGPIEG
jgi:hypothetical protein